ncbi:hypothetical protein O181_108170 [Austropuccinia psidii MF-1]|uniref:Tc1-like transposase DDE domain-containing protein n=1 Tax=Austropuccinia psidii MF-1 TaxID=1389203 RepID=A0A9Q3JRU8_9BASI|nr:hypothetical protein [Austropuccinia psidii MF-1]
MILVSVSNHTTHLFDILSNLLTSIKSKMIISTLKSTSFVLLIVYDDNDHSSNINFVCSVGNDVFKDHRHLLLKILYNLFRSLMPHLDEGTRGRIVGLREAGLSIRAISQKLNIATTTIHDTIKKYEERQTFKTLPIPGRPQKLNDQDKRQLLRVVNQHPREKLANIKEMITAEVSIGTDHQHWTINDWQAVIWTDESVFELGKKSMQTRVWRLPNEKYNIDFMQVNHRSGRRSVMIWGAFCGRFQSNLIIPPTQQRTAQNFFDNVYIPGLIPFIEELEELGLYKREKFILMKDGAPIHSAQISTEWRANNNIQKLVWPANSPYLNPIENLWFKMKYTVTTLYNPRTMDELQEAISMAWDSMPVSHLDALLASMPHRMQAVIHNNGAPVRW